MSSYKVIVTVPENEADKLREAIGDAGGGKVGNYTHSSFSVRGTGRFLPSEGANPTIGQVGKPEEVIEERIEINCDGDNLQGVVAAIREAHSYEEPAIDIYELKELEIIKQPASTQNAPGAPFLSQAIISNGNIYVSGQIHSKPDGSMVEGSVKKKMDQIMQNISEILKAADATINEVVKVVIYVTDMSQMSELNEVYPGYFNEPFPVREAVCVQALPLGATIELSVVASK